MMTVAKKRKAKTDVVAGKPENLDGSIPLGRHTSINGRKTALDALTHHDINRLRYLLIDGNHNERSEAKAFLKHRSLEVTYPQ